jgi:superkiller protein 3
MMTLLLERDGQLSEAADTLFRLSEILEHRYEESEDPDILEKFCIVKSDIARVSLRLGDFEEAIENGATALDLSQSIDDIDRVRLSSQIVVGLGYYFLGKLDEAIDIFQRVLSESDEDVDVMVLVAKALWSVGGDQEREIAIEQLNDWYVISKLSYIRF